MDRRSVRAGVPGGGWHCREGAQGPGELRTCRWAAGNQLMYRQQAAVHREPAQPYHPVERRTYFHFFMFDYCSWIW